MSKKELYYFISLVGVSVASFVSGLLTFASPLPLVISFRRYKLTGGVLVFLLSFSLVVAISGLVHAMAYFFIAGVIGAVFGIQLIQGKKVEVKRFVLRSLSLVLALYLFVGILSYFSVSKDTLNTFFVEVGSQIDKVYKNSPTELSITGLSGKLYSGKEEIKDYILGNMYSYFVIAIVMLIVINTFFITGLFPEILDRKELFSFRVPSWFIWIFLFCGFFVAINFGSEVVLAENFFRLTLVPYFFQGAAIVAFFMNRKKIPGFLKIIVLTSLALFMVIPSTIVGIVDNWIDFRKPKKAQSV